MQNGDILFKRKATEHSLSLSPGRRVYLSLGSNIGVREANLRDAKSRLGAVGQVLAMSSFYETEPVEVIEQPWFLNCAVKLETAQTPQQLMKNILQIERDMGRRRVQKKGPRAIDIDMLLFNGEVIESDELTLPHPAMYRRRFVLEPLAEIAPDALHPILLKTIQQLLDELPAGQAVRKQKP